MWGGKLGFTATAKFYVLRKKEKPSAEIFSVSYVAGHADPGRPVAFVFNGGPGATGRSYSDRPTIVESIRTRLLTLPGETVVRTGHGDDTTIGAETANVP